MLVLAAESDEVPRLWARSTGLGVRADSPGYPVGASADDLATRRDRLEETFRRGRARWSPIIEGLASRSVVAIVADPDGVILLSRGTDAFDDLSSRVRLVEGATWSESARGTNAIGTAIVERRAVGVIGGAHYEERNRGLFCYAKPIFDPFGDLVAVLDVTGPLARHDAQLVRVVEEAGGALEQALAAVAFGGPNAGALPTIERLVSRASDISLVVGAHGRLRAVSPGARTALGLDDRTEATAPRIFSLSFGQLVTLAQSGRRGMRYETARRRFNVELEIVPDAAGRAIAVVAHFEAPPASPPPRPRPPAHAAFGALIAEDARVVAAKSEASRLARTDLPVMLLAETGTGKELFARAIHGASKRAERPFVAINCGALGKDLLESELFGYAPGAFTGALRSGSVGKLGAADGGTLFLDEIAEMPDPLQVALLRVLDDGVYHRVGDARPSRSDFRLVCATCRDLPALVSSGRFRRDLFFRVCSASLGIPPVRERTDRLHLALGLLRAIDAEAVLARDGAEHVATHAWPGNVRELKSSLIHAVAMADGEPIGREHFPRIIELPPTGASPPRPAATRRDEILEEAIDEAMRAEGGNVSRAARRLGVARSTLYRALRSRGDAD